MPLDKVILKSKRPKKRKNRKTYSNSPKNKKEAAILKLALLNLKKRRNLSSSKKNKLKQTNKKNIASPICSLTNVLINKAIEKVKETKSDDKSKEDKIIYSIKEDEQIITNGGYGTVSKVYGGAPVVKYVNYDKLFSHLGLFKAKGMYEDIESSAKTGQGESTREMVSSETMEKVAKHFKYFVAGDVMGDMGGVPPVGVGVNSKDWEKYRLMSKMSIYQPIIKLKMSSA